MGRLDLHAALQEIMGTNPVYFQLPESMNMTYPCIRYEPSSEKPLYADNDPYNIFDRYTVTLIDRNPDSIYRDKIRRLRTASFDRFYRADNLNHFVYTIYY